MIEHLDFYCVVKALIEFWRSCGTMTVNVAEYFVSL